MLHKIMILLTSTLLITGCSILNRADTAPHIPTAPESDRVSDSAVQPVGYTANDRAAGQAATCAPPATWVAYQMRINETVYSLAARTTTPAATILSANCRTDPATITAGQWLYVPSNAAESVPETLLPLGIDVLAAIPNAVNPGDTVTVYWHAQGPVIRVRVGWVTNGQFSEIAGNLPAGGSWTITAPDDGRSAFTVMVRASDGLQEVAAQTIVTVRCGESWFFSPAPPGCPRPPVITTFVEQRFERGRIVYVPALGTHYIFVDNQPARQVADSAYPPAPPPDPALIAATPPGYRIPSGNLAAVWYGDAAIRDSLGWATTEARRYTSLLQDTDDSARSSTVYLALGPGTVAQFRHGAAWQLLATQ